MHEGLKKCRPAMLTTNDMRILEDNAEYYGVSKLQLMEHAGKGVADFVRQNYPNKKVLVVCGHGNNGGDGFVAARHLYAPVYFLGDEFKLKSEARITYEKIKQRIVRQPNLGSYDVIVDAIFGIGIHGTLKQPYAWIIKKINAAKKYVVAVDVPSGLDPDTGKGTLFVKPTHILTFHMLKQGLVKYKKITTVVDIGIPKEAEHFCGPGELKAVVKERPPTAHKGDYGKVLIIGGSKEYVGAPLLAGLAIATLRTGTDWVTIAAPEKVAWAMNSYAPDIITHKLAGDYLGVEHVKSLLKLAELFDVVLLGPGMTLNAAGFVKQFVKKIKKPMVIDADALKVMKFRDVKNTLFTPHKKEFELLLKNSRATQKTLQKKLGSNVVLLKGHLDEIFSKTTSKINKTGNPGMTVGGTGDVLAGLCAGFVAQSPGRNDLFTSACAAAFVNGLCGDECFKELGYGLIASDLLKKIAMVVKRFTY